MDYKFTLNLPKTKFSMKANLSNNENKILQIWTNTKIYKNNINKKTFILNDGPPYANGNIHIGHAFNKILKDFICKFKNLCSYNINFIPGWDCHGLPIELNVEKTVNVKNKNFRLLCKEYANTQITLQKKDFIRLGVIADWQNPYKTMDKEFEITILKSFTKMIKNNNIYLGIKPNYWCFECKSALAEAEVEYYEKKSNSIYFFTECINLNYLLKLFNLKKIGFIVWTTTPWTLASNEAIALNIKFNYTIFKHNNIGYIVTSNLLTYLIKLLNLKNISILKEVKATYFKNIQIKHPLKEKIITTVYSDHVKNDSGTGCVHIAPAFGYEDYKIGKIYNLPIINNISENGFFHENIENIESIQSKHYIEGNNIIINKLIEKNTLILNTFISHRYPHCWRHKSPLIFRTTNQWFLNVTNSNFKNKIFYLIDNYITWLPKYGNIKMKNMFKNRLDWCISRQRFWGTPIILFLNKNNELHPNTIDILKKSINLFKKFGSAFWYEKNVYTLLNIDKNEYSQIYDVLDVWFDSSAVYKYLIEYVPLKKLPHDICIEGSDQYRGWFQASLINSLLTCKIIPYKKIISHGFVLDNKNRKMSKSLNNVITPNDIINKYGADILRLWVASVNYTIDVNISDEIIHRICDAYRKFRNTFRFLISNIQTTNKNKFNNLNIISKLDIWILYQTYKLKKDIIYDYFCYNFHFVYKKLYIFCTNDLGIKYMDAVKDKLYTININSIFRISTEMTFFYILYNLLKLLAPIISFTTEEVWQYIPFKEKNTIFNLSFNTDFYIFYILKNIKIYNLIICNKLFKLKTLFNKKIELLKKNNIIGSSLETEIIIYANIYWENIIKIFSDEITMFMQTSSIKIKKNTVNSTYNDIDIKIIKTKNNKCERCWRRVISYITLKICKRCVKNIYFI